MARRHGSATALKASEVVAALAMGSTLHSHIGICQAVFFALLRLPSPRFPFPTDRATAADTPQTEMPWSLFLMAFPNVRSRRRFVWPVAAISTLISRFALTVAGR